MANIKGKNDIGQRGRARRLQLGLTAKEVAARIGIGKTRMSEMERYGVSTIAMAERWASALEIPFSELVWASVHVDECDCVETHEVAP